MLWKARRPTYIAAMTTGYRLDPDQAMTDNLMYAPKQSKSFAV